MGKRVNKKDLSDILGISERTLTEWQKEGMPMTFDGERGQSNEYDTAQVIEWYVNREKARAQVATPRDRLYVAQEELARIQIAEKSRILVPMGEIEPMYAQLVVTFRQRMLAIPGRLAPLLETTAGMDNKRALLAEAIDEALAELSNYEPSAGADPSVGPARGAAFEEDDRSMG